MVVSASFEDEILSLNAIYTEDTLIISDDGDSHSDTTCILQIPDQHNVSLRVLFPSEYPETCPVILGPATSGGAEARKGEASTIASIAQDVLTSCFRAGEPCIFDLLAELGPLLEARASETQHEMEAEPDNDGDNPVDSDNNKSLSQHDLIDPPAWTLSTAVTEKKSVFLARAAHCTSVATAKASIAHLLATDKKAARATHNITAWRIRDPETSATYQDCDDDGETAAGSRLLHLLQVMDAWDVIVVVTRWYGGIHLGPDRFRLINQVAREAVVAGGFAEKEGAKTTGKNKR